MASSTVRSALAVGTGFIVIGALAFGTDALVRAQRPGLYDAGGRMSSPSWLLVTLAYVFVYASFGCWLAARLAPNRPMWHALLLGWLGLVFNAIGTASQWATAPAWYHVIALATVLPAAWVGGWLRERQTALVERGVGGGSSATRAASS